MTKRKELTPAEKEAAWRARMARWRHNGFQGCVSMAEGAMGSILSSTTATDEAREIARKLWHDLASLRAALRERKPGT